MSTEQNQEGVVSPEDTKEEGTVETASEIKLSKSEYEELVGLKATVGSLKRELKNAQKASEDRPEPKETSKKNQTEDNVLLQKLEKMSLRQAGLTHPDDIKLAKDTAAKWNMDIDDVLADEDFKSKLGRQQTSRDNAVATSNIRGSANGSQVKNTVEYWKAKGSLPTRSDIPDRKTRANIINAMAKNASSNGKVFYND